MNLLNFATEYPTEESCKLKLKEIRDKEGVICRHCGGKNHYWKQDKWQYECKTCKTRTTLTSGTIMHGSQLPMRYWFITLHLLTSTKKSFSAQELQKQLEHKYYEPIWGLLHKVRYAMGKRDDQYQLSGEVELDEGYFTTTIQEEDKDKPLKRGRGSQRKSKVLVMVESKEIEGETTKKGKTRKVGYLKMQVIDDLLSETIDEQVTEHISPVATIKTDDSTSYVGLKDIVENHDSQVIPKKDINKMLPWVHLAISNAKRMLLDVHHSINPAFLQSYLNEFCYKFNRRYFGESLFDRLLVAGVTAKNDFRYRIR